MATPKQIAANRRNSQKSTGPKSPETKAKVSQNRTVHGLCSPFQVLKEVESQEEFDFFLSRLMEDEKPVGQGEIELVVKMAEYTWLSKRAMRMQNGCFVPMPKTPEQAKSGDTPIGITDGFELYLRYHTKYDRAYQQASAELQKRKEKRRLAEIGFERQKAQRAEQIRKAEKHKVQMAIANLRKQREEIKTGSQAHRAFAARCARSSNFADALPPDFNPNELNSLFGLTQPAQNAA